MHPIFVTLSSYDLRTVSDLPKLNNFDESRLRELHGRIYETLGPATYDTSGHSNAILDPFTFVASSSMRGEGGCAAPSCRFRKLDLLNRFGALYATRIVLPIGIGSPEFEIDISALRSGICFLRSAGLTRTYKLWIFCTNLNENESSL